MRKSVSALWFFCAVLASCVSVKKDESTVGGVQWYSQMHQLSENHSALIELIESPTEFYNSNNYDLLRAKTQEMAKVAIDIKNEPSAPRANPIISYTSLRFAEELTAISQLVQTRQMQFAHYRLSHVPNYCISCHSRADRGATNYPVKWVSSFPKKETVSLSKALFFLSNRQYESGHREVEKIVGNEQFVSLDPKNWLSVVQKDLAILVRVEKNIKRAQGLVEAMLKNKNLPEYIKNDVKVWKESLVDWAKESKTQTTSAKDQFSQLKRIIESAERPPYSKNEAAFILNLRASGILNILLESSKTSNLYADYLHLAGNVAEDLVSVDLWDLSTYYWESCIETSPGTEIARTCYNQLERFVLTTSKNSLMMSKSIDEDVSRLAKFKEMSRPMNTKVRKMMPER